MYVLCTLTPKGFMIRILGQKNCLDISYESLNIFFLRRQSWIFFQDLVGMNYLIQDIF